MGLTTALCRCARNLNASGAATVEKSPHRPLQTSRYWRGCTLMISRAQRATTIGMSSYNGMVRDNRDVDGDSLAWWPSHMAHRMLSIPSHNMEQVVQQMKDWTLKKDNWGSWLYLTHMCVPSKRFHGHGEWYCHWDAEEKKWRCPGCREFAPEEMGFVAELAGCRTFCEEASE